MKDANKKKKKNEDNNVVDLKVIAVGAENDAMQELEDNLLFSQTSTGTPVIKNAQANYNTFLKRHPDMVNVFAFDDFDNKAILTAPIPGSHEDNGQPFRPRPFDAEGDDVTDVVVWLDWNSGIYGQISTQKAEAAMRSAAKANRGDRLKQYLEECAKNWDGTRRIEHFFRDYMVAREWNAYSKAMGEVVLIGQVLRGLYPGAQLKMMPIIEGEQNVGKSASLRALCPEDDMFGDSPIKLSDTKIVGEALKGKFLIELAELVAVYKTDQGSLKSFVSRTKDDYRGAYKKDSEGEPRRCMVWGSTNEDTYLRDETGATRFYPIEIDAAFPNKINEDRDQLLGEAVIALKEARDAGEPWWELPPEAQEYLEELRDAKADDDPYTSTVMNYVEGLSEVTTREIVMTPANAHPRPGLGLDNRAGRGPGMQVAAILRKNGWRKAKKVKSSGPYRGQAVYLAPETRR